MIPTLDFVLPEESVAREPPERRGLSRDRVRLLVLDRATGRTTHSRFDRIGEFLRPGDLLVFNSSQTLPSVLDGWDERGSPVEVRLAQQRANGSWRALLRGHGNALRPGESIRFRGGLVAVAAARQSAAPHLWTLWFSLTGTELLDRLHRLGRPVRYEHVSAPWPLADYQTVYATHPGSAEMPSAGRAFTWRVLFDLRRRGIETADVVLHTGLSSYLDDAIDALHPVAEEEYIVSDAAAAAIERARRRGGRIVAVGTTVVRALESAVDGIGRLRARHGYTRLRITEEHSLRAVDGLVTGLHEPEASHLDMLAAFVSPESIRTAYVEAVERGYLWHEFGDLNLIL